MALAGAIAASSSLMTLEYVALPTGTVANDMPAPSLHCNDIGAAGTAALASALRLNSTLVSLE